MRSFDGVRLGTILTVFVALWVGSVAALAQPAPLEQQLAGSWRLVQDNAANDGLGPNPKGMLIFAGTNFSLQIVSAGLTPFRDDDRHAAMPEELQASGKESLAFFGSFTADAGNGLTLHVARSSFPNWSGADQKWNFSVTADKLTLTDPVDSNVNLVWSRIPPTGSPALVTRGGRRVMRY